MDIEKPLETLPLEPDGSGSLEYACAQYIVLGSPDDFTKTAVGPILADLAGAHPSTGVEEAHFVIELSPIRLKWTAQDRAAPPPPHAPLTGAGKRLLHLRSACDKLPSLRVPRRRVLSLRFPAAAGGQVPGKTI